MDEKENAKISHKGDNKSAVVVNILCIFEYLLFSLSHAVADLDIR